MDHKNISGSGRSRLSQQPNATVKGETPPNSSLPQTPIDSSAVDAPPESPPTQRFQVDYRSDSQQRQLTSPVPHNDTADQFPSTALHVPAPSDLAALSVPTTSILPLILLNDPAEAKGAAGEKDQRCPCQPRAPCR